MSIVAVVVAVVGISIVVVDCGIDVADADLGDTVNQAEGGHPHVIAAELLRPPRYVTFEVKYCGRTARPDEILLSS